MVKEHRYYTYKVTFRDLPGYFYYGKKKDSGKPYFGSPKTFRKLWDLFEPEIQILQWYRTAKEVEKAEDSLIEHTWKQEWGGKRYSLNRHVGSHIDEETCKKAGSKNTLAQQKSRKEVADRIVREKKGIHNPDYLGSKDCINNNKRAGRKGGLKTRNKCSKPVICVETGETYASAHEAGRQTKKDYSNIARSARSGGKLSVGGSHWIYADGDRTP